MNQRAAPAWARTAGSSARSAGTTRMTPSPPTPARRSARAAARAAVRPRMPSRSGTSTKSFSVPCPLVKVSRSAMRTIVGHVLDDPVDEGVPGTCEGVEPADSRVGPEPRLLAAHQPPGAQRGVGDGILERGRAVDDGERLGVADRPARRASLAQAERHEPAGLVDQPGVEHPTGPAVDAGIERLAVGAQADEDGRPHELAG